MVYNAETCARNAEKDTRNDYGMCLQQTRQWCGIDALYGDAATAWANTNRKHKGDRHPPRGAPVWWTGGSHGYGHIALSLGGGKIRSTDAGGTGVVATVGLDWPHDHWGLTYAGWSEDLNEITIPGLVAAKPAGPTGVWDDPINKWFPGDQDATDTMPAGQQMNQARGYLNDLDVQLKKIHKALEALEG